MVKLADLLKDADRQLKAFTGERYKTAVLYKQLLSDITGIEVDLNELTQKADQLLIEFDTKQDLLKMIVYNYHHFENKKMVAKLLNQFDLDSQKLKPLSEVV